MWTFTATEQPRWAPAVPSHFSPAQTILATGIQTGTSEEGRGAWEEGVTGGCSGQGVWLPHAVKELDKNNDISLRQGARGTEPSLLLRQVFLEAHLADERPRAPSHVHGRSHTWQCGDLNLRVLSPHLTLLQDFGRGLKPFVMTCT